MEIDLNVFFDNGHLLMIRPVQLDRPLTQVFTGMERDDPSSCCFYKATSVLLNPAKSLIDRIHPALGSFEKINASRNVSEYFKPPLERAELQLYVKVDNLSNAEADVLASSLTTYVTSAKVEYDKDKEPYKEMLLEYNKIDWEGLVGDIAQISALKVTEHHPVPVPSSLVGFRDAIDRVRTEALKRETVKKEYMLIFTEWASGNNSKRKPALHFFWTVFWPIYGLEKVMIEQPKLDCYWRYNHKLVTASDHLEYRFVRLRPDIAVTRELGNWSYTPLTVEVDSNVNGKDCVRGIHQMVAQVRASSLRIKPGAEYVGVFLFVTNGWEALRFLVYKPRPDEDKIKVVRDRIFDLKHEAEFVCFVDMLYNIKDYLRHLEGVVSAGKRIELPDDFLTSTAGQKSQASRDDQGSGNRGQGSEGASRRPSKKTKTGGDNPRDDIGALGYVVKGDMIKMKSDDEFIAFAWRNGTQYVLKSVQSDTDECSIATLLAQWEDTKEFVMPAYTEELPSGRVCLVMPRGQPFKSPQFLSLSQERAKLGNYQTVYELFKCVAALHARTIAHQDIKPANFVVYQNTLRIIDFGCALRLKEVNDTGMGFVGTEGFTAPEVSDNGRAYSPIKADLWAVGKMIKHLFASVLNLAEMPPEFMTVCTALQSDDPNARPSMAECLAFLALTKGNADVRPTFVHAPGEAQHLWDVYSGSQLEGDSLLPAYSRVAV